MPDKYARAITDELNKKLDVSCSYYIFNPYNQAYSVEVDVNRAKFPWFTGDGYIQYIVAQL